MAKSFPNTGVTIIDFVSDLPGSPVEGLMVFQKDSNELKIFDGSSWISMLDTDTPPGLVHIESRSFTASSGESFNSVFTSTYSNYRIIIDADLTASTYIAARLRVGTTDTVGSAYSNSGRVAYFNGSSWVEEAEGSLLNDSRWRFVWNEGSTAGLWSTTAVDLHKPEIADNTHFSSVMSRGRGASRIASGTNGGVHSSSTQFDGITIYPETGTFTGSVSIYGYRNS